MILHVTQLDKFIPPFFNLVREEFQEEVHKFWLIGSIQQYPVKLDKTTYHCKPGRWCKLKGYLRLLKQMHQARKVMLHGLFDINTVRLLVLCPWLLPKCYWLIWGGDLYQYNNLKTYWRSHINELLRRFVISRVGHLVTYIKGDLERAQEWYGATGTYHECIMYLSNVVEPKMIRELGTTPERQELHILLGNSADPSNNHIEALGRLLPFKRQAIKIFAPLSYGDQKHAKKVISSGKEWFGDKFVPMTDFMPFEKYVEFLQSLDIVIFNHQRQQAMGNTITLLSIGKTVFMRKNLSHWHFLTNLGVKLNDVENIELCRIAPKEAEENSRAICLYFSRATLVKQLTDIFEG
ncbi:TDP-N-acetylfucosamine:lipid II N-acetylfucosaminyltransferase [Marinobacter sp. M-5]|uniref:TDP-N-acetylfucosamine:lipid II N-acetylfucosaminyltransferase n=1 Tax=Marinobacter sp. M-5 TaxID=3081089 RepID=UPI00293CDCFC|nr:TDP-N-acetylfucosamine:lipid II N-acetylfucosaminyltransferase [Marinobacter sp. M-5]MDV3503086.1 TDP-N-acetylfucosamine:lipid II N-acetylfucosaminyltransferase [Marinobacter sp. M-5]